MSALFPKPDGAVQAGSWDSTNTQQTDHPLCLALGNLLLGAAQVRTGVFLSCRGLQSSLPKVRSKAGHGVQAQTFMAGQPGFQT